MTIKVGSVYTVKFNSGNTASAFSWPSNKIPESGNDYMKNKVIHITKYLNPKKKSLDYALDYDYVGDIYDTNDDAIELKNIKIVSGQLTFKSSKYSLPGRKKASGKGKKSKKRTKKSKKSRKSRKRTSRKTRRSYIKKTRKRMRGGWVSTDEEELNHHKEKLEEALKKLNEIIMDDPILSPGSPGWTNYAKNMGKKKLHQDEIKRLELEKAKRLMAKEVAREAAAEFASRSGAGAVGKDE